MKKNYFSTFLFLLFTSVGFAQITELYISKYGEGSANNKFLEIYNGTGAAISLDDYAFATVGNSPSTPGEYEHWNKFPNGATIAAGDVYIIAHPSADASILAQTDYQYQYMSNGNDGLALVKGGTFNDADQDGKIDAGEMTGFTILDWLGDWQADPGEGWEVAGIAKATKDHTLTRKSSVCGPNNDWANSAGTNETDSEWIVGAKDSGFSTLGSYSGCISGPSLTITAPSGNQVLDATTSATISINVESFNVAETGGDGYIKWTVDNVAKPNKFNTNDETLTVAPGNTYVVYMELVDNAGNPLATPVNKTVTFSVAQPCDLNLSTITTTCNAVTSGVDNYTATIAFSGGNTGVTYTLTSSSGTIAGDNPNTAESGTISITGLQEGTDVIVTIKGDANSSCDLKRTIYSPSCIGLPLSDSFDYNEGANLGDQPGWSKVNGGDEMVVSSGSLDYTGLKASTGNSITFGGSGSETAMMFEGVTSGTVYASFLFKVTAFQTGSSPDLTDGGYFASLAKGTSSYDARVWIRPNPNTTGTTYDIGFGYETSKPPFSSSTYNLNDVILLVMSYNLDTSEIKAWINPAEGSLEGTEPTADFTATDPTPPSKIDTFILRQDSTDETPTIQVDELRLGSSWVSVTPKVTATSNNKNEIEGFAVYPNPVKGNTFTLNTSSLGVKNVSIYNVLGKRILETKVYQNKAQVNVANLNTGIYILKIEENGKIATKKLVIK